MLVRDVMSRNLHTITADTKLVEVASMMCLYRIRGIPVVEGEKLIGFIAEKDVLNKLFPTIYDIHDEADFKDMEYQYRGVLNLEAKDAMISRVVTVPSGIHVLRATSVMIRNKFRRIPVADKGKLVGMLSMGDVHKAMFHTTISNHLGALKNA